MIIKAEDKNMPCCSNSPNRDDILILDQNGVKIEDRIYSVNTETDELTIGSVDKDGYPIPNKDCTEILTEIKKIPFSVKCVCGTTYHSKEMTKLLLIKSMMKPINADSLIK